MKRYINLVMVLVATAALVSATLDYKRRLAAAKTNHAAETAALKRNAEMKTRIDGLRQPAASQPADTGAAVTDAEVSAMLAEKTKADAKSYKRQVSQWNAGAKKLAERLKNDPDFALKRQASMRAKVELLDAPFCRLQHLSKEQSESLAEAQFQRLLRFDEIETALQLDGRGVNAKARRQAANDEFAANAKAALGDDLYEQYSVYRRQGAAWDYVNAYGGNMALADMPLSVEQSARLAGAIANACPAFQEGKSVDMQTARTVDWTAVDAAAVNFLTPEQMIFFRTIAPSGATLDGPQPRQWLEWVNTLKKFEP